MARNPDDVLRQAMEFYVAGQIVEARVLLLDLIRVNPRLEAGWMFLGLVLEDPKQKMDCYRQALAINPANEEAKSRLSILQQAQVPAAAAPARLDTLPPAMKQNPEEQPDKPVSSSPLNPSTKPSAPRASPFTVDISHANDEVMINPLAYSPGKQVAPFPLGSSSGAIGAANPPVKPEPASDTAQVQSGTVAPFAGGKLSELTPSVVPADMETQLPEELQPGEEGNTQDVQEPQAVPPVPSAVQKPLPAGRVVKKNPNRGCTCFVLSALAISILITTALILWITGVIPSNWLPAGLIPISDVSPTNPVVDMATPTPIYTWTLPPRWTDTPTLTPSPIPTITMTPTDTPEPTLAPPTEDEQASMDTIEQQVSDLRGLKILDAVPIYIVTQNQAETVLQRLMRDGGYADKIDAETAALIELGLIKPTYDMRNNALNRLSDGIAGFFVPMDKNLYVIGSNFTGYEKFVFSHEFDHALVDQHFPSSGIISNNPMCVEDSQRCDAITALSEGDATLIMNQWANQYAGPLDLRDIMTHQSPFTPWPEQFPPPYTAPSVYFPYVTGLAFVNFLYQRGNWAAVNAAYNRLPISTEQIIHPEKYLAGEKAIPLAIPDLQLVLGVNWQNIKTDTLGEFMTDMVLGYGVDTSTLLSGDKLTQQRTAAVTAAAGWGGDHYQVYEEADSGRTVFTAEWVWDTAKDENEFSQSMLAYLDLRYRGNKVTRPPASCWEMNETTSCLFRLGSRDLWVIAPDMETVDLAIRGYPGYG